MAKLELSEETKSGMDEVGTADLLIAVVAQVDADQLQIAAAQAILGLGSQVSPLRIVVAFPGAGKEEMPREPAVGGKNLRFVPYSLPSGSTLRIPWLTPVSTYQAIFALGRELGVSACAVIGFDLSGLRSQLLAPMLAPRARETLSTCHAVVCHGQVRWAAEFQHPLSPHPSAVRQAGALFPWPRTSAFRPTRFPTWRSRCSAPLRRGRASSGRQPRRRCATFPSARCLWIPATCRQRRASI